MSEKSVSEQNIVCPYCPRTYVSKESLNGHIQANHWKQLRPKQRGKSHGKICS